MWARDAGKKSGGEGAVKLIVTEIHFNAIVSNDRTPPFTLERLPCQRREHPMHSILSVNRPHGRQRLMTTARQGACWA